MLTTEDDRLRAVLDDAECRRLLGTVTTGRLAFTDSALPAIVPVSFTVHDGQVLIPARRGSHLVNAVRASVVAVQADTYVPGEHRGWSVTVVGPSRIITDAGRVAALDGLAPSLLPPDPFRCYITVQLALVRGWRMTGHPTPPASADAGAIGGDADR